MPECPNFQGAPIFRAKFVSFREGRWFSDDFSGDLWAAPICGLIESKVSFPAWVWPSLTMQVVSALRKKLNVIMSSVNLRLGFQGKITHEIHSYPTKNQWFLTMCIYIILRATPGVCPGVTLSIRASTIINYHGINYHHFRVKVLGFRF